MLRHVLYRSREAREHGDLLVAVATKVVGAAPSPAVYVAAAAVMLAVRPLPAPPRALSALRSIPSGTVQEWIAYFLFSTQRSSFLCHIREFLRWMSHRVRR